MIRTTFVTLVLLDAAVAVPSQGMAQSLTRYTLVDGTTVVGTVVGADETTVTVQTATAEMRIPKRNILSAQPIGAPPGVPSIPAPPPTNVGPTPFNERAPNVPAPTASAEAAGFAARGIEFDARFGVGSFFDDSECMFVSSTMCPDSSRAQNFVGPGAQLRGSVGYRPFAYLSFGLAVGYGRLAVNPQGFMPPAGWTREANVETAVFGPYVRVYALPVRGERGPELWASIGLDFVAHIGFWYQDRDPAGVVQATGDSSLEGMAVPLALGFDYYLVRGLALGASLSASVWLPRSTCSHIWSSSSGANESCNNIDFVPDVAWSASLGARYSIFF